MKYLIPLLPIIFSCCNHKQTLKKPPEIRITNFDVSLKKADEIWRYKGQIFSGYMIQVEKDGRTVYELPIIEGKENGTAKGWYNSGEKLIERIFIEGKIDGKMTQWWPNGRIRYLFQYKNDKFEGSQWVFFPNGKRRELSNYSLGEKERIQQVWDEKGILISNYTIKNKKLYGIISVESCIPTGH